MAFAARGSNGSSDESTRSKVDWKSLNDYMIETCRLQEEEVVSGVISNIIDLGFQEQEDGEMLWTGTPEEEAAIIAEDPDNYFEDMIDYQDGRKEKRYKRWPAKPLQCTAITVDFPEIPVDKGQFFGESNTAPLRLLLGGEFQANGTRIVAKMVDLKNLKSDKTNNVWSFTPNHTYHKMAVGAKLIKKSEPFVKFDIDQLLGKALQFKVQVFKNAKGYYTEKCSLAGGLGRGMEAPVLDENLLGLVQFDADNDEKVLGNLRASIINTMKMSSEFEDSNVKQQLIKIGRIKNDEDSSSDNSTSKGDTEPKKVEDNPEKVTPQELEFDDDVPF